MAALGGCSSADRQVQLVADQMAIDPPALWRAESLGPDGRPQGAVLVCADKTLREGFARANAQINGRACLTLADGVERPGLYATRCDLDGRHFGLTVSTTGDPERDFTARFRLVSLYGSSLEAQGTTRFVRLGPCPAGWTIGDQARPGQPPHGNALAAAW
jgi:hypothetical protein